MDEDKILEEMSKGIDGLKADMEKHLDSKTAEKFEGYSEELKAIQVALNELKNKGEDPNDQKVKDLETRLSESEKNYTDITEQLRLSKAGGVVGEKKANEALKGFFFKDQEAIASGLRGMAMNDPHLRSVNSDLFATGGQLPAEAVDGFWTSIIAQNPTFALITNRSMLSATGTTDELVIASRALRATVEETAPTDPDAVSIRRRTITNVDMIEPINITKTFLEDNIERGNAEQLIINQIATQIGNDLEDLGWNGDDDSSTTFLAINDGWIKLAGEDGNVQDVTDYCSDATPKDVFHAWSKEVPTKYLMRPDLTYFVPYALAQNYAEEVASRLTGLGDQVLINGLPALRYFGRPVIPVPYLTSTTGMLTPAKNLYHAYRRAVTMDSEWVPRLQRMEVTITVRNDYEYSTGEAIVLGTSIPAGLVA